MSLMISENAIARLSDAAAQRNMDADELLIAVLDEQERAEKQDYEETCAALTEGFAELEAGLGRPLEEYVAESRARWAARRAMTPRYPMLSEFCPVLSAALKRRSSGSPI